MREDAPARELFHGLMLDYLTALGGAEAFAERLAGLGPTGFGVPPTLRPTFAGLPVDVPAG